MWGNKQKQIITSAYELEVIQKTFINTLRWTEYYIENSDYRANWQRQTEPIKRQDLNNQPTEIKGFMETALLGLDGMVENRESSIIENLQEQFYSWLDKSGISVDECSEELIECLVNIYKVLNGEGKEFSERVANEASENISRMTPEERRRNFYNTFTVAQRMMEVARARQKNLEGKTHRDIGMKNSFLGNVNEGKEKFNQIKNNKKILGQLTNDGGAIINNEYYEPVQGEIQATQEQIDIVNQKQHELAGTNAQFWIPVGVGGGFVALVTAWGIRLFEPSLR